MRIAHVAHVGHGVQRYFLAIRIIRYFDIGKEVDSDLVLNFQCIHSCPCLSKQGGSDVFFLLSANIRPSPQSPDCHRMVGEGFHPLPSTH